MRCTLGEARAVASGAKVQMLGQSFRLSEDRLDSWETRESMQVRNAAESKR